MREKRRKGKQPDWDKLDPTWVQSILDDELTIPQIARKVGIPATTLHKAIENYGLEYDRDKVMRKVDRDIEAIKEAARRKLGD